LSSDMVAPFGVGLRVVDVVNGAAGGTACA
jgi:hypothetical protein